MLTALLIRDFVLIRRLDLDADHGLTTLTGETGAGKSIILDALGLCLGAPAEKAAIRAGASAATVSAEFDVPSGHPVWALLEERGIAFDASETVTCKRLVRRDKPARAFVNDQAVSAGFLAELGEQLVEIHGQGAASTLMRPAHHRDLLDQFAGAGDLVSACRLAWGRLHAARKARAALEAEQAGAREAREWLVEAVTELDRLDPQPSQARRLSDERALLLQAERLAESVAEAESALKAKNVEDGLAKAARAVERVRRVPELAASDALCVLAATAADALERALIETQEAAVALAGLAVRMDRDEAGLEAVDERLHALKAAARKHGCDPDLLHDTLARLRERLSIADLEHGALDAARQAEVDAAAQWRAAADALTKARASGAKRLEKAIEAELGALHLGRVSVRVVLHTLGDEDAGSAGAERVEFEAETNTGAGFGALRKVASGGELARFSLALKCALADGGAAGTLVFDEVDQGVGGAVAAAVGDRLRRLAETKQVFAVTHSPQVAACGEAQWRISKSARRAGLGETHVSGLNAEERIEEIARMLSGAEITPEARAAATRLLQQT